jgi:hypothetical protein
MIAKPKLAHKYIPINCLSSAMNYQTHQNDNFFHYLLSFQLFAIILLGKEFEAYLSLIKYSLKNLSSI